MLDDGTLQVQRHEIFDDWSRIRNQWIIIEGNHARTFEFHHSIYSGQELRQLLREAGFETVNLYGDLDGNAYGTDLKRLVAVAEKRGNSGE